MGSELTLKKDRTTSGLFLSDLTQFLSFFLSSPVFLGQKPFIPFHFTSAQSHSTGLNSGQYAGSLYCGTGGQEGR